MAIKNNLWRRGNSAPTELPYRDYGPDLDGHIVPWDDLANNAEGRAACDWQPAPDYPDYDPILSHPVWTNTGWQIVDTPRKVPGSVSHKEFLDLLTYEEQVHLLYLQKQVEQMSPADFGTNIIAQMLSVALYNFNSASAVELNNPQTIRFVNQLLVPAGIVTAERAEQILTGYPAPGT